MSKIVLLSKEYLGVPSANGICARNIVDELIRMGHDVYVVCYQSDNESANLDLNHILTVIPPQVTNTDTRRSRVRKLRNKIKFVCGCLDSMLDLDLVDSYYQILYQINFYKNIDLVIAMYFPPESLQALQLFKKESPNVKAVVYELDSVGDGVAHSRMQRMFNHVYDRWMSKVYKTMDAIIIMKSHSKYWNKRFGKQFGHKVNLADIPVLSEKHTGTRKHASTITMIYAGTLDKRYRSPSYLLSVLKELDRVIDYEFLFYSKGDCEEEISNVAAACRGIYQKGYVANDELEQSVLEADILVSIGNTISHSVPSKMIDYLSYGKPIIHFSSQKEDVCNGYLVEYPLALVIDQSLPVTEACERICEFIRDTRGKTVDCVSVQKMFPMNVPSYSAKLICGVFQFSESGEVI